MKACHQGAVRVCRRVLFLNRFETDIYRHTYQKVRQTSSSRMTTIATSASSLKTATSSTAVRKICPCVYTTRPIPWIGSITKLCTIWVVNGRLQTVRFFLSVPYIDLSLFEAASLSPDNRLLAYTSITSVVYLADTTPGMNDTQRIEFAMGSAPHSMHPRSGVRSTIPSDYA